MGTLFINKHFEDDYEEIDYSARTTIIKIPSRSTSKIVEQKGPTIISTDLLKARLDSVLENKLNEDENIVLEDKVSEDENAVVENDNLVENEFSVTEQSEDDIYSDEEIIVSDENSKTNLSVKNLKALVTKFINCMLDKKGGLFFGGDAPVRISEEEWIAFKGKIRLNENDIAFLFSRYNGITLCQMIKALVTDGDYTSAKSSVYDMAYRIDRVSTFKTRIESYDLFVDCRIDLDGSVHFISFEQFEKDNDSIYNDVDEMHIIENIEEVSKKFVKGFCQIYQVISSNELIIDLERIAKASNLTLKECFYVTKMYSVVGVWKLVSSTLNRNNRGYLQVLIMPDGDISLPILTNIQTNWDNINRMTDEQKSDSIKCDTINYITIKTTKRFNLESDYIPDDIGKHNIPVRLIRKDGITLPSGEFGYIDRGDFRGLSLLPSTYNNKEYNEISLMVVPTNIKFAENCREIKKMNKHFKSKADSLKPNDKIKRTVIESNIRLTYNIGSEKNPEYRFSYDDVLSEVSKRANNEYKKNGGYDVEGRTFKEYDKSTKSWKKLYDNNTLWQNVENIVFNIKVGKEGYEKQINQSQQIFRRLTGGLKIRDTKLGTNAKKYAESVVDKCEFQTLGVEKSISKEYIRNMKVSDVLTLDKLFAFIEDIQKIETEQRDFRVNNIKKFVINDLDLNEIKHLGPNGDEYIKDKVENIIDTINAYDNPYELPFRTKLKINRLARQYNKITNKKIELHGFKTKVITIIDDVINEGKQEIIKLKEEEKEIRKGKNKLQVKQAVADRRIMCTSIKLLNKDLSILKKLLRKDITSMSYIDKILQRGKEYVLDVVCKSILSNIREMKSIDYSKSYIPKLYILEEQVINIQNRLFESNAVKIPLFDLMYVNRLLIA